jgi:hypothetical protein
MVGDQLKQPTWTNHFSNGLYTNQQRVLSFAKPFACLGIVSENAYPRTILLSQNGKP